MASKNTEAAAQAHYWLPVLPQAAADDPRIYTAAKRTIIRAVRRALDGVEPPHCEGRDLRHSRDGFAAIPAVLDCNLAWVTREEARSILDAAPDKWMRTS